MIIEAIKSFLPKTYNDRQIRKLQLIADEVDALESDMQKMSDDELKLQTQKLRDKVKEQMDYGMTEMDALEFVLPEAFATVRETASRILGERHYNCQLIGGVAMFRGNIVEMRTGEGKTLVSTLPVYLHALMGNGVHVVTVNDYLAKRDSEWMGQVHRFLGLSVGLIYSGQGTQEKAEAYACDITYGTNNEYGFDYLRDNMATHKEEMVQRRNFCIIDEVDSVLIDEARTPLIISGAAERNTELYIKAAGWVQLMTREKDYTVDEKAHSVYMTDEGIATAEKVAGLENLYAPENLKHLHHMEAALKAKELFKRDIQYVVQNGEVIIIDEFTGRLMPGRRYSDGLHGAIEAKENVPVASESLTLAQITFQNYFRLYNTLSGMTGTAMTEVKEFAEIYDLDCIQIPTNKAIAREDKPDLIYKTKQEKYEAIVTTVKELNANGQPVLIGTISIENSEDLANAMKAAGLECQVLNAKYHEMEAEIVAQAGQKGMITIATNMAGRGTDIKLGEGVADCGGLYIIGSERHESRRIDNQLRGRAGRQGDPGTSQFYLSLEDDLMRIFGGDSLMGMANFLNWEYGEVIDSRMVTKALENAQRRVETMHFEARKHILKYDNVMNEHRKIIYEQRAKALSEEDLREDIEFMLEKVVEDSVKSYVHEEIPQENWDFEELSYRLKDSFLYPLPEQYTQKSPKDLRQAIFTDLKTIYEDKESRLGSEFTRHIEKAILLQTVDTSWKEHLTTMEHLKEGIGLRGYGQRDPLVEYKLEATDLFNDMIRRIKEETISLLFKLEFNPEQELEVEREEELRYSSTEEEMQELEEQKEAKLQPIKKEKIGRNDPCPCGSGKKFKKCHGQ